MKDKWISIGFLKRTLVVNRDENMRKEESLSVPAGIDFYAENVLRLFRGS